MDDGGSSAAPGVVGVVASLPAMPVPPMRLTLSPPSVSVSCVDARRRCGGRLAGVSSDGGTIIRCSKRGGVQPGTGSLAKKPVLAAAHQETSCRASTTLWRLL